MKTIYNILVKFLWKSGIYHNRFYSYSLKITELIGNRSGTILDTGCGPGLYVLPILKMLSAKNLRYIGIDISTNALMTFLNNVKKNGHNDFSIDIILADAHFLPIRQNTIDTIISISLIEHLENPEKYIDEISDTLKTGGIAIVQIPNMKYFIEPHTNFPLFGFLPKAAREAILQKMNYAYTNTDVTPKYVIKLFKNKCYKYIKNIKIYHLKWLKIIPYPFGWFFLFKKDVQNCTRKS